MPIILPALIHENNLKRNINNRFQGFISKPRITVKSFANVSCLKELEKRQEKTQEEMLQNLEIVIDAVARGETISTVPDPIRINTNCQKNKANKPVKQYYYLHVRNVPKIKAPEQEISPKEYKIEQEPLKEEPETVNESIYCDLCNETFKNSVDFCLHSIKHNNNERYSCHVCEYKTTSMKNIDRHVKAHERKTVYNCEICNKGFTNCTQAAAHKNLHSGEKPFVCDICGKAFGSSPLFSQHRRDRHWKTLGLTPIRYDCEICDKKYTSNTGYRNHFKRHHIEDFDESELCDICGKRLSNKEHLKFHRRTHTGYKPHACNICEKRFSKNEQLREHMRVHSGEKPYKCRYCSKCFTQGSSRQIHERIHTGERPYKCHLCKKGFTSKGVLVLHLKRCEGLSEDSD